MTVSTYPVGHRVTAPEFNAKLELPLLLTEEPSHPLCVLRHSLAQTAVTDTNQILTFDTEVEDTDTMHAGGASAQYITCRTPGVYYINAMVNVQANATGYRALTLYKGAAVVQGRTIVAAVNGNPTELILSCYARLIALESLYIAAFQNSGISLTLGVVNNVLPQFAARWVAP